MPGASDIARGNMALHSFIGLTLTPVAVAGATSAEQTFTVPGLVVGDFIIVQPAATTIGVGIGSVRASAANTLAVTWVNATAAPVTPAAGVHQIIVFRATVNPLPTGLE